MNSSCFFITFLNSMRKGLAGLNPNLTDINTTRWIFNSLMAQYSSFPQLYPEIMKTQLSLIDHYPEIIDTATANEKLFQLIMAGLQDEQWETKPENQLIISQMGCVNAQIDVPVPV